MKYTQIGFGAWYYMFLLGSILGSILPDVDHEGTKVSAILPKWLHKRIIHRGRIHSLLCSIVFGGIIALIIWLSEANKHIYGFAIGVTVGCIIHIRADALTKAGIKYFWYPFWIKNSTSNKKYKYTPKKRHN
jgi:membrane-bound metal-dependent hydrolase YbcI (DUF457 family)